MKLYLASGSASRQLLLEQSKIPFTVIEQTADELACDWQLPFGQLVVNIAQHKMKHALMPPGAFDGEYVVVLTADSLVQDEHGEIYGKPIDKDDALSKFAQRNNRPVRIATGFCLAKKQWHDKQWTTQAVIEQCVVGECRVDVPEKWREAYYRNHPIALKAAGGFAVEGYGMQFLKSVHGSMTTIIGLPLYEVRQALDALGFFDDKSR
jgi:nucleoside triphosphate pyrophosphatase